MIHFLIYYLFVYPVSRLPFRVLYLISDIFFLIIYRIVGYRRKVVAGNLRNSFPDKTDKELLVIEKRFYSHFCDLLIESLKAFTISEKEAHLRMTYTGTDILNELAAQDRNLVMIGGHYGNWELLAITVDHICPHQCRALYSPLKSPFWEKKMKTSRTRFGLQMYPIKEANSMFATPSDRPTVTIFGSDQSPRKPERAYWTTFLNQDTGIQFGAEKFAKEHNCVVIFGSISKLKRGYYNTHISLITDSPNDHPHGEIMELYNSTLEHQIRQDPAYYLWTHKRWKHKRPEILNSLIPNNSH